MGSILLGRYATATLNCFSRITTRNIGVSSLLTGRLYSKKTKSTKKGGERLKLDADDSDLIDFSKIKEDMAKQLQHLQFEFSKLKIGRANPGLLESIMVKREKTLTPLSQVAQVAVKDPLTLMVLVSDETYTKAIDDALRSSGLNLVSTIETSTQVKVKVPKPSGELRGMMVKQVHKMSELVKQRLRQVRQEEQKKAKKKELPGISEDDKTDALNKLQSIAEKNATTVDDMSKAKVKEIMEE